MPKRSSQRSSSLSALTLTQRIGLVAAAVAFCVPWFVTFENLTPEGHRVLSIFLLAVVLWVTEAIPLHATATIIILSQILLISDKALIPVSEDFSAPKYSVFYAALAHPVLMLFLGGFFLADGAAKYRLDRNLARILLRPFGTSPKMILLGLMLITAMFSMFMSNTATTATMMAVVIPVLAALPPGDRMRAGLALCIPVAANVGGIGTPVGTPPNAIALGALADAGIVISFVQWMIMAMPFMLITLAFSWVTLALLFRTQTQRLELVIDAEFDRSPAAMIFYGTFAATILLWMTEPWHGISSNIVGFLPVVVLLSTRVFSTKDMQTLQWHVLWLVAGGIALGVGVAQSGLDSWLIGLVRWESLSAGMVSAMLCLVALLVGTVISHSATANLLVPIGMSLALSPAVSVSPVMAGVFIAIGSSLAMALPITTPPNAIAYATGAVKTRDMAISGILIGAFGWALFVYVAPPVWSLLGVLD